MKRRPPPTPADPPPIDRARVHVLLEEANAARESGEIMHGHPALEALGDLCGVLACYVFVFTPDDARLSASDLDALAAQLSGASSSSSGASSSSASS